jgi:DNA polymerase elongation subunit (family B)
MSKKAKILFWDIETSLSVVTTFTLYPKYISHDAILQDWNIICGAWKFAGDRITHAISVGKDVTNDKEVVKKLRDVVMSADMIVHHNGDKFDIKMLNTRLIYHGLEPLDKKILTLDTLKEARKTFRFTSNRLDYLGEFLGVGRKLHTKGGLWMDVLKGNQKAVKEMVKYNKHDVDPLLESVYYKMKPYINHPHMGAFNKDGGCIASCPNCASKDLQKRGTALTRAGLFKQRYQCKECGAYSQENNGTKKAPKNK